MRRIFTHRMDFSQVSVPAVTNVTYHATQSWLMQEDIEVIGVEVQIDLTQELANDGMALGVVEISQSGHYGDDGLIARINAIADWNSAPAFGGNRNPSEVVVMFPEGYSIPVKQEGHLYMNGYGNADRLTAGTFKFAGTAIVYYVKKVA